MSGPSRASNDELIGDVRAVADDLGHWPTSGEYNLHGEYSCQTLRKRLGVDSDAISPNSWVYVLEDVFGADAPGEGRDR